MPYRVPQFNEPEKPHKPIRRADAGKKERDAFYSGSRWEKTRAAFLAVYPTCQRCEQEGRLTLAEIAHHVIPRLECEDPYDWENLAPYCWSCHSKHEAEQRRIKRQ